MMQDQSIPSNAATKLGLYTPFQAEQDHIRLLRICNDHGEIGCKLEVFAISQAPAYLALSYEWASSEHPARISIDKGQYEIRRNLYDFIQRSTAHEDFAQKWWWIDAICINQADLAERSHQVKLMSRIYSQASSVIGWLGPARDYCQIAVHKIRTFSEESLRERPWTLHERQAIIAFCQRTYWTRLWVLQELTLSRHTVFVVGNLKIEGSIVLAFAHALVSSELASTSYGKSLVDSPALSMLRESRKPKESISLCERVIGSGHLQSENKHDKVFAVLNISDSTTSKQLQPDYQTPMETLLFEILCAELTGKRYSLADAQSIYDMCVALYRLTGILPLGLKTHDRYHSERQAITCDSRTTEGRRLLSLLPSTSLEDAPLHWHSCREDQPPLYAWFVFGEVRPARTEYWHRPGYWSGDGVMPQWRVEEIDADERKSRRIACRGKARPAWSRHGRWHKPIWTTNVSDALIESRDDWD